MKIYRVIYIRGIDGVRKGAWVKEWSPEGAVQRVTIKVRHEHGSPITVESVGTV